MKKLLFLLVVLVGLPGCQRRPAATGTLLRVLSYNIHHANPPAKADTLDVPAIAALIRNSRADVVFLQEVDVRTRRAEGRDQAADLARLTGLKSFFVRAIDYDGGEYGVAILSKYELTERRRQPLPLDPASPGEPRVLGMAVIEPVAGHKIRLACTHLDAQPNHTSRELQAEEVVRFLRRSPEPVLLGGDFNALPGSRAIQTLEAFFTPTCQDCPPTSPQLNPRNTIDYLFFAPKEKFKAESHEVIQESYASDHLPVLAVLRVW